MTGSAVSDFDELLRGTEKPVVVDFWAPWCGPCRQLGPVLESVKDELGDSIELVKINVDDNPALTAQYGVSGVPTIVLFKGGEPVQRIQGARPKGAIVAAIRQLL
ncbi:thioredoxin [Mycolicibacterium sp.]|uniref:thioredoxin n=1 Tax=Mycolicibacterium sp. TaxID=2320850 RepID=UPI003D0CFB2D